MYYLYVLLSDIAPKTYTGITNNPERRLKQHNKGYHLYTKRFIPWKIVYLEKFNDRIEARKREKYFKSAAGRRWLRKNVFEARK